MCDVKIDGLTNVCTHNKMMIKFIEKFIIAFLGASTKVHFWGKKILQVSKAFIPKSLMD